MNPKMMLKLIAVSALAAFCLCSLGWGQVVVSPEPEGSAQAAPPALTSEEREFLMSLTRVKTGSEDAGPVAREGQPAEQADRHSIVELVERVDQLLARMSRTSGDAGASVILQLLESPHPDVRVTALNWAIGIESIAADALFKGIQDEDELARESAFTHLLGFGVSQTAIAEARQKVKDGQELGSFKQDLRVAVHSKSKKEARQ